MQNNFSFGHYGQIIIHTPHAGTLLPVYSHCHPMGRWVRYLAIEPLYRQLTDHYTNELFKADMPLAASKSKHLKWWGNEQVKHISFPYSRLFCDVERLIDDPLEEKGLGICYDIERYINKKPHSWSGVWSMTKQKAMELYNAHHETLRLATDRGDLLLDCHSFSERPNILCRNADDLKDIDICLGFNEDDSKPSDATIYFVADFFRSCGYSVELNKPFSNAISTGRCHSLMIEVNKHCYMNEDTLAITAGYYKLHAELQQLYHLLLNS